MPAHTWEELTIARSRSAVHYGRQFTTVGSSMNERHAAGEPVRGRRTQYRPFAPASGMRFELKLIGGITPSQNRGWQTSEP
jgi:hypothetical protein